MTRSNVRKEPGAKAGASAAGIGGGTLTVFLAQTLPESSPVKSWLLFAAPSVTAVLGAAWLWANGRISRAVRDREFRSVVDSAKAKLLEGINNPNTSDEHRAS